MEVYKGHAAWAQRTSRVVSIEDEDGVPCVTTDAQHQRWRRHFNNVLNTRTRFVAEEMEKVCQREVRADLANIPSQLEVTKARRMETLQAPLAYYLRC